MTYNYGTSKDRQTDSILYTAALSWLQTDVSRYSVLKPRSLGKNAAIVILASSRSLALF